LDSILFDSILAPLLLHTPEGDILDANPAAVRLYGHPRERLAAMHLSEISLTPPSLLRERFERIGSDGELAFDSLHRTASGKVVEVHYRARTVVLHGETAILTILEDRTEERKAMEVVRHSERLFRAMVESSPVAIAIRDVAADKYVYTNPKFQELLGYQLEDLHESGWWDLAYPDPVDRARVQADLRDRREALAANGWCEEFGARVTCKDGTRRDMEFHPVALEDRVLTFCIDLTHHRNAQRLLERMATAVEQSGESIVITDADATIRHVNQAFERLTGYSRAEAVGRDPRILQSGRHDPEFYRNLWATLHRGEVWRGEFVNRRKDGTLFEEHATISPIRDSGGAVVGYVAVKRDVTEENRLRRELHLARKMEALGTLAGGIAHDFNNVLGAILGYADLALDRMPAADPDGRSFLEKLKGASFRARDLVGQILTFSRQGSSPRKAVSIPAAIREVVDLLQTSSLAMVRVESDLGLDDAWVMAEPTQLHQILMNLGTNAVHALGERGGTVTIELVRDPGAPGLALLSVRDDGCGIQPEVLDRIFDPFFTTKPPGEGTGIGLAVVARMVRDMGGSIGVESVPGSGTTFSIRLPLVEGRRDAAPDPNGHEFSRPGIAGGKILFVDDEPAIRDAFHQILTAHGLHVTSTREPLQALRILEERKGDFDLLVTDLSMPGMDGLQLAERAGRIAPDLPVLLCTGFLDRETEAKVRLLPSIRGHVVKPLERNDFLRRVAASMRRGGRP
jgi:PAS domain S-box-containing protein